MNLFNLLKQEKANLLNEIFLKYWMNFFETQETCGIVKKPEEFIIFLLTCCFIRIGNGVKSPSNSRKDQA